MQDAHANVENKNGASQRRNATAEVCGNKNDVKCLAGNQRSFAIGE